MVEEAKPDAGHRPQYVCNDELGGRRHLYVGRVGCVGCVGCAGCAVNLTCLPSSLSKVNDSMTVATVSSSLEFLTQMTITEKTMMPPPVS